MWRRRKNRLLDRLSKPRKETGSSSSKQPPCRQFTIAQIRSASKGFNERLLIGRGRWGDVYKGTIENGTIVAICRWKSASVPRAREFQAEVDLLSVLQHPNIVCLMGYCNDGIEMILVYEYISNGTLSYHLHKYYTPLSWLQRLKICIDVARALLYLHNGTSGQEVVHNNVRSSAILLDNQWAAKIKDFAQSQIFGRHEIKHDLFLGRKISDMYSFGLLMMEVLYRRSFRYPEDMYKWVYYSVTTRKLEQMIDPELKGQISHKFLNDYARIAEFCLRGHHKARNLMAEVVFGLETILALQERMGTSVPQMSITTSDYRLQEYFFSSAQISGGRYFKKDIKRLSSKSFRLENFDQDHKESLYDLMELEYIQRADVSMRMKDFLHLIWSYPVKKEADVNFGSLVDKFSTLKAYIKKSLNSVRDENNLMKIQRLLHDIEEDLDDAAFDMAAYVPEGLVPEGSNSVGFRNLETGANSGQVPFASFWSGVSEVYASAVASATHRAVSCIKDLKVKKLGISGSGAEEVTETLKGMPELTRAFDVVLCVGVKNYSIGGLLSDVEEEMHLWRKRCAETGNKITVRDQFLNCLLFVDFSDEFSDLHEAEFILSKWFKSVQTVMTSGTQNVYHPVDLEIRVEDQYLPWVLFSINADLESVVKYSSIQKMATSIIEQCHGHLLAIILLARALRGVVDDSVWELALQGLASQEEPSSSQFDVTSDVIVRVLTFIWTRMEPCSQRCIIKFASHYGGAEFEKESLINSWIRDGLVRGEEEGVHVFEDLIYNSFLLEPVGEHSIRMREENRVILLTYFAPRAYGLYLKLDGSESNKMPNVEEWDAREIDLSNNIISELPDNPNSPILVNLLLHFNQDLMVIPITFFDNMPILQVLDLSGTGIRCLPSTISKLTTLRKLFIRDCSLLMELPPEIGALKKLTIFDSEGTQLLCLPKQFGLLTKLECLKISLYRFADKHKGSNQSMQIVHTEALSKLERLKELSISVDMYSEWWEDEVKLIVDILPKVRSLESLRLYFPTIELLEIFITTNNWIGFPIYQQLSNFGFVVGHLGQRLISRVSRDLCKAFLKMPKCLTYTNGEGDTEVIGRALTGADALFIDRHWTVPSLSAFGLAEMRNLKFCLLAECNEMLEIVNGSYLDDPSITPVLGSLEHLSIHYMKSLTCILNRPIDGACLPKLKTLAIHTCPKLSTMFTQGLLDSLTCLEYLIVQDCATINSLVSLESYQSTSTPCLPNLKKISLLCLPELVSISRGISIAPRLESLVVYDCPNLHKLSHMEASDNIRVIKGENDWWDALKWCEPEWTSGQPDYLATAFTPLGTNGDIMAELADAVNLLPHLGIWESTKEARTLQANTRPGLNHDKGKGKV